MSPRATPIGLLRELGLLPDGPVLWGQPVASRSPGVYLIEWPEVLPSPPFDHQRLRAWLERVPTLRIDGEPPTPHELAARLARSWLPEQSIVYVGQTKRPVRRRVAELAGTPLGDPGPHAGGRWLLTLRGIERARIWWAETDAPEEYEDALLESFAQVVGVSGAIPFANIASESSGAPAHGITGDLLAEVPGGPATSTSSSPSGHGAASKRRPSVGRTARPRSAPATPPQVQVPRAREERDVLTAEGIKRLRGELDELRELRRPEVIARVKAARELGDLRENAEYHSAREEQSFLEGRIQQLQATVDQAMVADGSGDEGAIRVGSTVDVEVDGEPATYTLVGPGEAKIAEGRLSYRSPIGAALLGRRAGEIVSVATPAGQHSYTIRAVR